MSRTPGSTPAGSLGALLGSVGSATVTGVDSAGVRSTWDNLNGEFQVGQSGHGTLLISDGGLVRMFAIFGTRIGTNTRGVGEVTVTGSGTSMQMPGEMDVGFSGQGHLTISAGATVNNDGGRIARNPNSIGDVVVTGSGSTWTNTDTLTVGIGGAGSLTLADGGRAIAPRVAIAQDAGSSGVLTIGAAQGASPVAPGTLSTIGPVTFGAGAGRIVFNHTDTSGAYTFAPLIAGAGQVVALSGTTVLSANNSYSGGTTLGGGVLQIASDANLGATSGALSFDSGALSTTADISTTRQANLGAGGGTFETQSGTTLNYGGVISGNGALTKAGDGTLVLSEVNTYGGGTTINAGTVSVDSDSNLGAPGGSLTIGNGTLITKQTFATNRPVTLTANATLIQAVDTGFTLNGVISGSGSLALDGDGGSGGLVTLNAGNTYTGATNLNRGFLFINGSIATSSQLITNPGTFLGGTGTLPQTTVGGIVSPGPARDTTGTLNIAGSLTTAPTANYIVDFNPSGAHDLIHATGVATLNNADATTLLNGFIPVVNQRYAILTADGGVNGTFNYPTRELPLSTVSLTYDQNNAYFLVARNQVPIGGTPEHPIIIPPPGGTPDPPIAITPPQESTGGAVDELPPDNPILGGIILLPTVGEIRVALDQLSGQINPSLMTVMLEDSHFVRDAVFDRLDTPLGAPVTPHHAADNTVQLASNLTAWIQGVGAHREQGDLSVDTGGTFLGFDSRITDTTTLGVLFGYTRSNADARYGSADGDNYTVGAYVGTLLGPWSLKAGTSYTFNEIDTRRTVNFGDFSDSPHADYSANTTQVFSDVGYRLNAGPVVLEPYADLAWVKVNADGFTEHGGPAALTVDSSDNDVTYSTLGIRPSYTFVANEMPMRVKGGLGWRHTFGDLEPSDKNAFARTTNTFAIPGLPLAEDVTVVNLGVEAALTPSTNLSLIYSGQLASDAHENGLVGLLRVTF
ncbi:autotransporter domain-containing protein [Pseudomonas fluorescens]|uniref:autotransporter domain-containing protein n=1 Tax=Pseudomonas fluorescens TaxID=294 RepID=UPI001639DF85|nr:autotransporter domain-containing protein [Pseudomonas fluorescens]